MSSNIATAVCGLFILALFLLERDRKSGVSSALWIPVAWFSISASRFVAQWFGGVQSGEAVDQLVEGNPLDASIFAGLMAAGLGVLLARRKRTRTFLRANGPILLFFFYCAASVLWSDYPFVSFKRWVKAVGDLVMVLVILTDPNPTAAVKRFLARSGFLLIPLSILLIKYYPSLGRQYSLWTGEAYNGGVATGKNGLGILCLIFGLGSFWYLLEALWGWKRPRAAGTLIAHGLGRDYSRWTGEAWNVGVATQKNGLGYVCLLFVLGPFWYLLEALRGGERARAAGPLIAQGAILAMALWLFSMANSATSLGCFLIGGTLVAVTRIWALALKPAVVHLLVGTVLFVVLYGLVLDPGAGLVEAVGRDSTLTGRTAIWAEALTLTVDPLFGTGYESFWLNRERLNKMAIAMGMMVGGVPHAHNGYLEIFLNLGFVGVVLLGFVVVWGYRSVIVSLYRNPDEGRLKLAFFVVALVYNLTEYAFRPLHPVGIVFLLAITVVPETSHSKDTS